MSSFRGERREQHDNMHQLKLLSCSTDDLELEDITKIMQECK